jgi:hypothetical protein
MARQRKAFNLSNAMKAPVKANTTNTTNIVRLVRYVRHRLSNPG